MNRIEFLYQFRRGLSGLPRAQIEELVLDTESHFSEGKAAGRSEEEIAAALGDPARMARELRAEAGFKRWESEGTPSSLAGLILALLGLATVDVMFLFPFLFTLAMIFLVFAALSLGLFIAGLVLSVISLVPGLAWFSLGGGIATLVALGLAGLGLIAGGVGLGALVWWALRSIIGLLIRYARLHFQLIDAVSA